VATEKTSWEVEMDEDVSPAARKAETALGRLHKMIQRFSASGMSPVANRMNAVRNKVNGLAMSKISGYSAATGQKFGPYRKGTLDERVQGRGVGGLIAERVGGKLSAGGSSLSKFGKKWDKFKKNESVNDAFEGTKNGVMIAVAALGAMVAGITIATIKMVDFGQKSRAAFGMMLGGAAAGNAAFQRSRDLAKEMGMDIADVTGSYQRFLSMGFDTKESEQLIKMGADMTALGNSSEKVRSVLDAMGKINATGTMQGDELMMLAEAGINIGSIYDVLGKKLGKTRAEIVKMKEAGKITSRQAIDAIKETVLATTKQTEFGAARKVVISSTLGGGWDQLKAQVKDKMIGIADATAPALAKAMGAVNKRISAILNSKDGASGANGIVTMINWIAELIETNVPTIEGFFRAFIDGASEVLGPIMEMGNSIGLATGMDKVDTAKMLGKAIGQLVGVAIAAGAALGGGFLQALISIANVLNDIIGAIKWVTDNIGAFIFSFSNGLADQNALKDYAARNGGSMAGVSNSSLNGLQNQAATIQAGSSSKNVTNNLTTNVTAQAPAGGTKEDGRAYGEGIAQGNQRATLRYFESANVAQGT
jgi:tape measure domain-containing protein